MTADDDPTLYIIPAATLDQVCSVLLRSRDRYHYKLWEQLTHAEPITTVRVENTYQCPECEVVWADIWSSCVENDCENCGERHLTPIKSVELEPVEYHRRPLTTASSD